MDLILIFSVALLTSLVLTYILIKLAEKQLWFDIPNQRSSHVVPTPKAGGLAFVLVFYLFVTYLLVIDSLQVYEYCLCALGLVLALTGLVDDFHELPISIRLGVQLVVVSLAMYCLPSIPVLNLLGLQLNSPFLYILLVPSFVWLINLYNFMDGIDALAASEAIFISLAMAWFASSGGAEHLSLILLTLASALAGFLYFNLPLARIFMGDAGSNFLGYILGALGLLAISYELLNLWTLLILLGVFIVDSTLTLLKRMLSGVVWYHGHRNHAYQMAAQRYKSHAKVVVVVGMINLFWLFPLALTATRHPNQGLFLLLLAWLPLLVLVHRNQTIR